MSFTIPEYRIAAIHGISPLDNGQPFTMDELLLFRRAITPRENGIPTSTMTSHRDWCKVHERWLATIEMVMEAGEKTAKAEYKRGYRNAKRRFGPKPVPKKKKLKNARAVRKRKKG